MGHTLGDAYIVIAICGAVVAWLVMKHLERTRRLEIVHKERLAAMDKGIPLPELPLEPARAPKVPDPRAVLIHGIAWSALGFGGLLALLIIGPLPNGQVTWPMTLPLAFLGAGLVLYYVLASRQR